MHDAVSVPKTRTVNRQGILGTLLCGSLRFGLILPVPADVKGVVA